MKFVQKDFELEAFLKKPLMAHLATAEGDEPRNSPVWFLWEDSFLWLFGTSQDSFIKRLQNNPNCAVGIVDFVLEKGVLKHVGMRGNVRITSTDQEKLNRFLAKYLGHEKNLWNRWFLENIAQPIDAMVQIVPKTIVAKDVSFFKTGPDLAENLMPPKSALEGISHITLICKNLEKSAKLFCDLFGAVEVYCSQDRNFSISKEKFFLIDNLWIALMEGEPIERSYNHIAFSIKEADMHLFESKIQALGLEILPGRSRSPLEGKSLYFYDYDNHLFELHTGDLSTRLNYYRNALKLRAAERSEIGWVNQCYDQVEFLHSDYDNEIVAIAEFDNQNAGLGRLVKIDETNLELGGIYVFDNFRGKGIAKELVKFLLARVEPSQTVYCIPFEHLLHFYKQCGFTNCSNFESVPQKILDKLSWCKEKYSHPTNLLVLESQ